MIETDPTKICFIVVKAREVQAKVEVENPVDSAAPEPASDAPDEGFRQVLEDFADDATYQELRAFLESLNEDERIEILALLWLGRGDFDISEWDEALREAADRHDQGETDYLIGTPMLADFLEAGLEAHGLSCAEVEADRL